MRIQSKKIPVIDLVVIFIFLGIFILFSICIFRDKNGVPLLYITTPEGEYIYQLNTDRIIKAKGLLGYSKIEIKNGAARFLESPCPNGNCINSGKVRKNAQWAACLPNDIFIRVENNTEDIDTGSY